MGKATWDSGLKNISYCEAMPFGSFWLLERIYNHGINLPYSERLAEERRARAAAMLAKLKKNNLGLEEAEEVFDPLYLEDCE